MESGSIKLSCHERVAVMAIDNPPANTVDLDLLREAQAILKELDGRNDMGALVITGAGKCFCAGADLKTVPFYSTDQQRETVKAMNSIIAHLYDFPLPLVAAVNGHAIAAGFVLILACDYRIASETGCKVGMTEIRAGVPFPSATMEIVKVELQPDVARRLVLTGNNISSAEALKHGVFDELQPADNVLARAIEVAKDFCTIPQEAYSRIKKQLRGAALERIKDIVRSGGDPLLDKWLGHEAKTASERLLGETD